MLLSLIVCDPSFVGALAPQAPGPRQGTPPSWGTTLRLPKKLILNIELGVEWPNAHHQLASIKQRTNDQQWQSSKKQRGRPQTKFKTSMKHQSTNVHNLGDQHVGNHEMEDAG